MEEGRNGQAGAAAIALQTSVGQGKDGILH